jgi:WD40 repeat protein
MALTRGTVTVVACLVVVLEAGAAGPPARHDLHGAVLPLGAVARLGSTRLRQEGFLTRILLSPDGRSLLVPGLAPPLATQAVYVRWDLQTGARSLHSLPVPPSALGSIDGWALFPDGKRLLHWGADQKQFAVVDLIRPGVLRRWSAPADGISCLVVAPRGPFAAVGFEDGHVEVHDLDRGKLLWTVPAGRGPVHALAFTPDSRRLALVNSRREPSVRLVELLSGKVCREVHLGPCKDLALAPDGRHVAARMNQMWVWELASGGKRPLDVSAEGDGWIAFRPDGKQVLVSDRVQQGTIVDVTTGKRLREVFLRGLYRLDTGPRWTADGKLLVGVDQDTTIRAWNVQTGRPSVVLPGHDAAPRQLVFTPDGRSLTVLAGKDAVFRWETTSGRQEFGVVLPGVAEESENWSLSPDGTKAVEVRGTTVKVIDIRTGRSLYSWQLGGGRPSAFALAPDSRTLATVGPDGTVALWRLETGKKVCCLDKTRARWLLQFTPDSKALAVGEGNGRVSLFDTSTGKRTVWLWPSALRDDRLLSSTNALAPWRWEGGQSCFSADGRMLFAWLGDEVRTWDVAAQIEVPAAVTEGEESLGGGPGGLGWPAPLPDVLAVSPDGRLLAVRRLPSQRDVSPSRYGSLCLWEAASGQVVHHFDQGATAVAFAPHGWRLAAGRNDDFSVLVWDLRTLFLSQAPPPLYGRDLVRLWADMGGADAARGHAAAWWLADTRRAVAFLARHLRPVPAVSAERLKQCLADLGSRDFAARRRAEVELAGFGEAARDGLRRLAQSSDDLEARLRARRLMARLVRVSPARLREHRAVLALELVGTADARGLLQRLSGGAKGASLTEEAEAALSRLRNGRPAGR